MAKMKKVKITRTKVKPTRVKKQAKRRYDNISRAEASIENRNQIISTFVDLLVEAKGADVSFAEVAKKSNVSQRTIFRFFKDKSALLQATADYVGTYLQESNEQLSKTDFLGFVRQAFRSFDNSPNLIVAYLFSSFGQQARTVLRKDLNKILIAKLRDDFKLKPPAKNSAQTNARIAFIVSLMNTRVWYEMKTDFGYTGAESGETVAWAVRTLVKSLVD